MALYVFATSRIVCIAAKACGENDCRGETVVAREVVRPVVGTLVRPEGATFWR